jgi:hypothetical protein
MTAPASVWMCPCGKPIRHVVYLRAQESLERKKRDVDHLHLPTASQGGKPGFFSKPCRPGHESRAMWLRQKDLRFYSCRESPHGRNSSRGQSAYNGLADGAKQHILKPFTTNESPALQVPWWRNRARLRQSDRGSPKRSRANEKRGGPSPEPPRGDQESCQ